MREVWSITKESLLAEIWNLPVEEQIELIGAAWDQIAADPEAVPVPEWHLGELERRLANPDPEFISLEELQDRIDRERSNHDR